MKKIILSFVFAIVGTIAFAAGHIVTATATNASCNGVCDGTVTTTITGGVGPFSIVSGNTSYGICAGTYTITVVDSSDMSTASATVTITQPAPLGASLLPSYTICAGSSITLSAASSGGCTYSWAGPGGYSCACVSPVISPTSTSTYTVSISCSTGCVGTATTTVNVNPPIILNKIRNNPSCFGACDGSVGSAPTGGSGAFSYVWSGGGTTSMQTNLCAGTYTLTVTDVAGCYEVDTVSINNPIQINANFTMVPDSANPYNYWTLNTTAGSGMSYLWSFGDGTSSSQISPTHTYAAPGTYNVCLMASSALCTNTRCETVLVTGTSNPCLALFNIATDTNSSNPNAFTVYNLSYGANLTYLWDFGDGNTSTLQNPTHIYASNGNYLLCLTVDNGAGCTQTFCDSLMGADSLSRTFNPLTITVVDGTGGSIVTGINENVLNHSVKVSPNPFSDATTFVIHSDKTNETYTFELFDVLGKKVMEQTNITAKQFSINRNSLENGMYFYKIYAAESVVGVGKVIVK